MQILSCNPSLREAAVSLPIPAAKQLHSSTSASARLAASIFPQKTYRSCNIIFKELSGISWNLQRKETLFLNTCNEKRISRKPGKQIQAVSEDRSVAHFNPECVELLYPIGQLSLQKVKFLGQPPLQATSETSSDDDERESLSSPSVNVYAARIVQGELAGERVVLKEYISAAEDLAINELQVYGRLQETRTWYGAFESDDPPVLYLLGYFQTLALPGDPLAPNGTAGRRWTAPVEMESGDGSSSATIRESGFGEEPEKLSTWLVFRWEALRAASIFAAQEQQDDIMSIFNPFETVFPRRRASFLKKVIRGALEALGYCHARGVIHGAISLSCIILSTFDEREIGSLRVKLASFGLGSDLSLGTESLDKSTIETCRSFGATSPLEVAAMLRQLDLYYLGLALLELVFGSLSKEGVSSRFSMSGFQALWEGVFQLDMAAIKDFCREDEEWDIVVAFLDEGGGGGWELFEKLLKFQGLEADAIGRSAWLVDGVSQKND